MLDDVTLSQVSTVGALRRANPLLVAVEIVRMLVGSIGLVISVPVTTLLAALILSRTTDLPDDHGHHHGHLPEPVPAGPAAAHRPRRSPETPDRRPSPRPEAAEPWF